MYKTITNEGKPGFWHLIMVKNYCVNAKNIVGLKQDPIFKKKSWKNDKWITGVIYCVIVY